MTVWSPEPGKLPGFAAKPSVQVRVSRDGENQDGFLKEVKFTFTAGETVGVMMAHDQLFWAFESFEKGLIIVMSWHSSEGWLGDGYPFRVCRLSRVLHSAHPFAFLQKAKDLLAFLSVLGFRIIQINLI